MSRKWLLMGAMMLALGVGAVRVSAVSAQATPPAPTQPAQAGDVEEPNGTPDNDALEQGDQGGPDAQCGPQDAGGQETPDANEAQGGADTDTVQDCK